MSEAVEKTKTAAASAAPAATKPPKASRGLKLAVSLHKVNGIEPGTPLALDAETYDELLTLEAIREISEAEAALYEKSPESVVKIVKTGAAADIEAAMG